MSKVFNKINNNRLCLQNIILKCIYPYKNDKIYKMKHAIHGVKQQKVT